MSRKTSLVALSALAMAALAASPSSVPWWWPYPPPPGNGAGQYVAFACYGGGGNCACPTDLTGDSLGVLVNVYPGYQCAYTGGACTWDDKTGALQNTAQTNCPVSAPCSTVSGCECPIDNNNDTGVLINQFTGYQCAYAHGPCTWSYNGTLINSWQTNCPTVAECTQLAGDS